MTDLPPSRPRRHRSLRNISALVIREMATTYGRSPGGYLWAVLEPIGGIMLLSIAFSLFLRSPPVGTSFALFYATGFLPFMAYMAISQRIAQSIRFSRPLLAYPTVSYSDAILARFFLTGLTQIMVFYVVMIGIHLVLEPRSVIDVSFIIIAFFSLLMLGLGVGAFNCFLFWAFPPWEHIWNILNRPLFIVSGIFFIYEDIPEPYQSWLWYNPLIHIVGLMRQGFYPNYSSDYASFSYVTLLGLTLFALGLIFLNRFNRYILNN